ncbi:hypothetical protein E1B28_001469 [Marasmius oreades]|uniref:Uncharacterized protein n=1 Tax=Marasmius oreades TaxID=181124 RepID=A0A9P8AFK9_9AGAR|nr:uncharacterized protein E1B28_001469 [Marasmius oreades]KAG7099643.1 hypothetical protein E1B28_001469 [Marasmius oreades]
MDSQNSISERHGRRRPPSVFDALMSLSPPSPILSAYSPTTCSSEEVPVLLFSSSPSDWDIMDADNSNYRSSIQSLSIPCSGSTDTIGTIGTVGTFGQSQRGSSAQSKRTSALCLDIKDDVTGTGTDDEESPEEDLKMREILYGYEGHATQGSSSSLTPHNSQNMNEPHTTSVFSESCTTYVSPPSPSPSVYSTLSCSSAPDSRLRSQVLLETRPISYSDYAGVLHSSTSAILPLESCTSAIRTSTFSNRTVASTPSTPSFQASEHSDTLGQPSRQLPKSLDWLRDIVVEMLIDQEGFRSVAPRFRFAGYSNNSHPLGDGLPREVPGGIAEFVPVSRQTFDFHYAPFEGQPVLRRLTTNGEARDYISRQATLSIKSNGVYTVNGSEPSAFLTPQGKKASRGRDGGDTKLRWKLDYFVDDKRGVRALEGEKTFTPLMFFCSPLLLHPLRGKKIRFMHVVKKSVVMKLVAERMELPNLLSSPRLSPSLPNPSLHHQKETDNTANNDTAAHDCKADQHPFHPRIPFAQMLINDELKPSRFRRRRASSGGEDTSRFESQGQFKLRPVSGGGLKQYQHILPPSKLSEMLDDMENTVPVENMHGLTPPLRNFRKRI